LPRPYQSREKEKNAKAFFGAPRGTVKGEGRKGVENGKKKADWAKESDRKKSTRKGGPLESQRAPQRNSKKGEGSGKDRKTD